MSEFINAAFTAHDGDPWSVRDTIDLLSAARDGLSIREAALILGRAGTVERVRVRADHLGISFRG
jgi:hypothetical protein